MWEEIFAEDNEGLQKFVDIDNSYGCIARLRPSSTGIIKSILLRREDAHAYIYDNGIFQILLLFIEKEGFIKCLRCVIKWDYFNSNINPKDALYITGNKTKEYMQERNRKLKMSVFSEEKVATIPDQHILEWYGDAIIDIYNTLGIKATRYPDHWIMEVI